MQLRIVLALGLCSALSAQNKLTVPSAFDSVDAASQIALPGLGYDARMQIVLHGNQLLPAIGHSLTAVGFRIDADNAVGLEPASGFLTAKIGPALAPPVEPFETFDSNLATASTVFQGDWDAIPARLADDVWCLRIEFGTPYAYSGGDLVLDLQGTASSLSGFWAFDATTVSASHEGLVQSVGQACGQSGPEPALVGARDLRPGGSPRFVCLGEAGAVGTLMIGDSMLPSPIDLGAVGFPGCALHIQAFATLSVPIQSFVADASMPGVAQIEPLLPRSVPLFGATLTAQWLNFGSRLEVSNALQLQLAAQPIVYEVAIVHGAPFSPTGTVSPGVAPVLRFEWE